MQDSTNILIYSSCSSRCFRFPLPFACHCSSHSHLLTSTSCVLRLHLTLLPTHVSEGGTLCRRCTPKYFHICDITSLMNWVPWLVRTWLWNPNQKNMTAKHLDDGVYACKCFTGWLPLGSMWHSLPEPKCICVQRRQGVEARLYVCPTS